ncbi:MAG TPA: hypothetical protein V6D47_08610 [Oscillatoriaceae cyanobacterium]
MFALYFAWGPALLGGLVGALAMTGFWYFCRRVGWMTLDWGQFLGTFFSPPGERALAIGLVWHFVMGLFFGVVYADILASLGTLPGPLPSLGLGVLHAVAALLLLAPATRLNPMLREGPTEAYTGRDLFLYALGFPIFGVCFGATYVYYGGWLTAWGMDPARFWFAAATIVAIALIIGLASSRLIPADAERDTLVFGAAMPDRAEQRERVRRMFEEGLLTPAEYEAELERLRE